ncbi:MAG: RDD family protein [Planctomycetaceae bacterium]|nr:RDD family protein [Planctomycetaceae bacterium]
MSESKWYVAIDGKQRGPISSLDLRKLVKLKRLKPSDLIWKEGLHDWVEAGSIQGLFSPVSSSKRPSKSPSAGNKRRPRPQDEEEPISEELEEEPLDEEETDDEVEDEEPPEEVPRKKSKKKKKKIRVNFEERIAHSGPAGFWVRVAAFISDLLMRAVIIATTTYPLMLIIVIFFPGKILSRETCVILGNVFFGVATFCLLMFYDVWQESSEHQATMGKSWFGLKVIDSDGDRLTKSVAVARHLAKYLSILTLGIGFMLAGITKKKLALHDMIAGTQVVREHKPPE